MNNIDSYIILNKNSGILVKTFIFLSLFIIFVLIFLLQCKYRKYYNTIGQVIKNNNIYQIVTYIPVEKMNIIKSKNKLIIDKKEYNYKIDSIDSNYIIDDNLKKYIKVIININLKNEDKIVNNIINLKFEENNKKIIYYLKEYLLKGSNI